MNIARNHIENWLIKNGFNNITVDFHKDFMYDREKHILYCGINANEESGKFFEQFLYEYGCEYVNIWYPVLCFLHELGHVMTISNFEESELLHYRFIKFIIEDDEDIPIYNKYFSYWNIEDEFEANCFTIDFINNHIEAVTELFYILVEEYNRLYEENKIWEYINEY